MSSVDKNRREEYDAVGHILAADDELVASSGFAGTVMDRVREESAALQPIPFPWRKAIPGMLLLASVLGWAAWEVLRYAIEEEVQITFSAPTFSPGALHFAEEAGWIALALAVSYVAWFLSMRVVRRSSWL